MAKMKIALISPKGSFLSRNPEFRKFWKNSKELSTYHDYWSGVSTGLLIVAALTPSSIEIKFIDENKDIIDFTENFDLVAISAMTQQAIRAYQIADNFRRKGIKVVIGGIHATILPEEAKEHCDSVIIGESEYLWQRFIEDFMKGKILPFYKAIKLVDLKDSAVPRYDLIKSKNYRVIWIQAARGCPRGCEFCAASSLYGQRYRHKTVEQVVDEIKFIKKNFDSILIGFGDDNMFIKKEFSKILLEKIIPLNIRWLAETDISIGEDEDLLDLLRRSGCLVLFIGFESLSREGLRGIDKHGWKLRQLDKYSVYIKKIQSYGIGIMGAFIVGLDSDDFSVFKKVSDFIIDNNLYAAQITILTPLPGTRLRESLEKEGRLLSTDWGNYTCLDANFIPKQISINQLETGLLEIYKRVYNREVYLKKIEYFKKIFKKLV